MDVFKKLGLPVDQIEFGLKIMVQSSIVWVGIFGNIYTGYCVVKKSKLPRSTNTFIIALSTALILQALTAAIDYADHFNRFIYSTEDYRWGYEGCDVWHTMNVYLPMCLTLLCFFCLLDRYIVLTRPQDHLKIMSSPTVAGILALCFLLPVIVCVPPIALNIYIDSEHLKYRTPNECKFKPNKPYALISPIFTFWIPLALVAAVIVRIFKAMDAQDSAYAICAGNSCEKLKDSSDKIAGPWKEQDMRRQHRLVLTLWSVYWNVALFWIPQHAWMKLNLTAHVFIRTCNSTIIAMGIFFTAVQAIYKITDADWPRATNFMAWAGYLPCLILPNLYCYYNIYEL